MKATNPTPKLQVTASFGLVIGILFGVMTPAGFCQNASVNSQNPFIAFKQAGDKELRLGNAAGAIPYYQKSLEINPDSAAALFNLAIAHYEMADISSALSALKKALRLIPYDEEILYNVACLEIYQKNPEAARRYFKNLMDLKTNSDFCLKAKEGLSFLDEFEAMNFTQREMTYFLMQIGEGLSPPPIAF